MSKYVSQMKCVLDSFAIKAQKVHADMERNTATYQPSNAADANARLQAELNQAAEEARNKIDAIRDEAAAAAKKWGELSGADIDAADLDLLKGDFQLSGEAVWKLLVKHQHNGTMVNAIAKYAKEHSITLDYIPNVEDKVFAYQSFAQSAKNVVGELVRTGGQPFGGLSMWGEPGNISQRMETVLYGIKEHEDPSTKPPKGNFDFGFKPLGGRG